MKAPVPVLLIIVFCFVSCSRMNETNGVTVDFSSMDDIPGASENVVSEDILSVAVATMTSPKETFVQYEELMSYLGAKSGKKVEFKQRNTYHEVNDLLAEGSLDLAFICSGAYVVDKDKIPLEILAVPVIRGSIWYRGYIIVNKSTPYHSFADLEGRRFAFTDPLSNSGYFSVLDRLDSLHKKPEKYFSRTIFTYAHDNSIRAIAKNLVDGASVEGPIFEYLEKFKPEEVENIRIIGKSKLYGIPPVVVPGFLDPQFKNKLRTILLTMHEDPEGKEILNSLLIDRFEIGDEKNYVMVRNEL